MALLLVVNEMEFWRSSSPEENVLWGNKNNKLKNWHFQLALETEWLPEWIIQPSCSIQTIYSTQAIYNASRAHFNCLYSVTIQWVTVPKSSFVRSRQNHQISQNWSSMNDVSSSSNLPIWSLQEVYNPIRKRHISNQWIHKLPFIIPSIFSGLSLFNLTHSTTNCRKAFWVLRSHLFCLIIKLHY